MATPHHDPAHSDWDRAEAEYRSSATGADPDRSADAARSARNRRRIRGAIEWVAAIIGAIAVAWLIQAHLVQAFVIPSGSMEPTLVDRDRVVVNKQSYRSGTPSTGDVVVFSRPPDVPLEDGIDDLIKRVVAVGGETVEARDGRVWVDGEPLDEEYLPESTTTQDFEPVTVPEGHLFVMGDNRGPAMSYDSRFFGPIDADLVVGRAFAVVWPPGNLSGL